MCPLDVLSRLSVLTSSGTIIVPRLVSRLIYDHLFSGARTIGASWTLAAKVTLAVEAVSAFAAAANIVSVAAEVAKAIVNGYIGMSM